MKPHFYANGFALSETDAKTLNTTLLGKSLEKALTEINERARFDNTRIQPESIKIEVLPKTGDLFKFFVGAVATNESYENDLDFNECIPRIVTDFLVRLRNA